jgi:uncharacterized protein YndB with AHSA1/START domain
MKWLLYALAAVGGLLVICVIVLLFLGGFRGESRLVASVDIARPPSAVFPWLSQPDKLKSWVGWMVDVRDLTPNHTGVGTKQVWVMEDRNNNNQRMDIASEITRSDPDRLLEAKVSAAEGFTGEVRYELESVDAKNTKLTYRATYKFDHWLAKLLEPVISRSAQQKLEEDLQRLKRQVEAE